MTQPAVGVILNVAALPAKRFGARPSQRCV